MTSPPTQATHPGWSKRELVGAGYLVGDGALFLNGLVKASAFERDRKKFLAGGDLKKAADALKDRNDNYKESVTGLGWAVGGAVMAKYGNRPLQGQYEALEQRLAAHFAQQKLTLSEDLLQKAHKERDKSFFAKIEDFMYRYPTEILNAIYGGLALLLVEGGVNTYSRLTQEGKSFSFTHNSFSKTVDNNKFGLLEMSGLGMGIMIVAGAIAGLLIKEKSKEQLDEAGATGFWRWVQEKPMRVTGGFYLANNFFTGLNMMANKEAYKEDPNLLYKNMYLLRGATLGSYLFSNVTLMGTATGAQKIDPPMEEAKQNILQTTARIILNQSPELQQQLIKQTAEYLSGQRELGFSRHTPRKLAEMITANLQEYAQSQTPQTESMGASWTQRNSGLLLPENSFIR